MHVISQSCVLFLWIQVLTSVESKDCTPAEFKASDHFDSYLETSGLESAYPPGSSVKVPCKIGYTGFFKILCLDNGWSPASGNKMCEPKSCGHPGDSNSARFRLVVGDDFVFGSEVLYTCNKGYVMISRSDRRRCLANGWDGAVPVCEARKCSAIPVDNNVQADRETDGATYGTIIRFSCIESDEMLSGPNEIICDQTGKWSSQPPTCKGIKCEAPSVENGRVTGNRREYKENEYLSFVCNEGYTAADKRPSKCTHLRGQAEWLPTPACREIKCQLHLQAERTTFDPPYKNVFSPGESVRVTCGEKDWVSNPQSTTADITCKDDGEWTAQPVCHEVICHDPTPDQNVYYWHATAAQKRLGGTKSYSCRSGFVKPRGTTQAVCRRDGWIPKPLCVATQCSKPVIENAEIVRNIKDSYREGESVTYRCSTGNRQEFTLTCQEGSWSGVRTCPGVMSCTMPDITNGFAIKPLDDTLYYSCDQDYKPFASKAWWGEAKCKGRTWSENVRCIAKNACGKPPVIPNGVLTRESGRNLRITCDDGYSTQNNPITCENGEWTVTEGSFETICSPDRTQCDPPPKVENAVIRESIQKKYSSGSEVTYVCRDKYMTQGKTKLTCSNGAWEDTTIICDQYCEKLQDDKLSVASTSVEVRYRNEDTINYRCKYSNKEGTATCTDGMWRKTVECEAKQCSKPVIENAEIVRDVKDSYRDGESVTYRCSTGNRQEFTLTCQEGSWSGARTCPGSSCSTPPYLENGDYLGSKSLYAHNERVEYSCQAYHKIEGGPYKICKNGVWTGEIRCLKPCTVAEYDLDEHNLDFLKTEYNKLYAEHLDHLTFNCKPGYVRANGVPMRQRCNDGLMTLPTCRKP